MSESRSRSSHSNSEQAVNDSNSEQAVNDSNSEQAVNDSEVLWSGSISVEFIPVENSSDEKLVVKVFGAEYLKNVKRTEYGQSVEHEYTGSGKLIQSDLIQITSLKRIKRVKLIQRTL